MYDIGGLDLKHCIKRILDFLCSLALIILLSPILLILAFFIRIFLGRPVLFQQDRPGRHGQIFKLYKYRSMTDERDENGNLLPDGVRLTKLGKFIRKTSLDELPELINILRGDMSFVGPRPLLVRYLTRYTPEQARRHEVRPGLTGWAQVNGRNAISWEDKFKLDTWYVDHWTLLLDVKIIIKTIMVVLNRTGISAEGEATMGEFMGNEDVGTK